MPKPAFVLPLAKLPAAPWLETPLATPLACEVDVLRSASRETLFDLPPYVDDTLSERRVMCANVDVALVRTRRMTVAVNRTQGVLGSLILPHDTTWVGLSTRSLFAATATGVLYRANQTPPYEFREQAVLPGTTHWDAGGRTVAALIGNRVVRSLDEGSTFSDVDLDPSLDVTHFVVRFDDVMVVQGRNRKTLALDTRVGRSNGKFQRSTFHVSSLFRAGGVIGSDDDSRPRLSEDGVTWLSEPQGPHSHDGLSEWPIRALETTSHQRLAEGENSFVELPPRVTPTSHVLRGKPRGRLAGSHQTLAPRLKLPATSGTKLHGAGAAAISGRPDQEAAPTNSTLVWLSDGTLEKGEVSRNSTLAILSRQPASLTVVPSPCVPSRVFSMGGVGLVVCRNPKDATIFTVDRGGRAYSEGSLPLSNDTEALSAAMARDGTWLLRDQWGETGRQAFVRSPLPLGTSSAWRAVPLGEAVEVRVAVGGGLLLIEAGHVPVPSTFSLVLDRPGERCNLVNSVPVEGSLLDLYVSLNNVVARTRPFETEREPREHCQRLLASGRLE